MDHIILAKDEDASRKGDRVACVLLDMFSQWLQSYPATAKSALETRKSIVRFLGPQVSPDYIYSDNSKEIERAVKDLSWDDRHDTSTPNRPSTNGVVERAVRTVKEGTSAALVQAGANPEWWADAMRYFTFVHNVTDKLADGKTPYERRFNNTFAGPLYPFGCEIEYKPSSKKVQNEMHPLGSKLLSGIFFGYHLKTGGLYDGDLFYADWEDFAKAESVSLIPLRRVKSAEMFPKMYSGNFKFPLADGRVTQPPSPFCEDRTRNRRCRSIAWSDEIEDDALADNDADDGRIAELQDSEDVVQDPLEADDVQDDVAP